MQRLQKSKAMTNLAQNQQHDPSFIEVCEWERNLPSLRLYGIPFEIIEQTPGSDLLRIRIQPLDSYVMAAYGIAHSQIGFKKGEEAGYIRAQRDQLRTKLNSLKSVA
jgi:hypothetical protein